MAFQIMMGSCTLLMIPASIRFIREGAYNKKAAIAKAIPGIVAELIAALLAMPLPLEILKWVMIVVILYTSIVMLRAGFESFKFLTLRFGVVKSEWLVLSFQK